jgi:hypothetical protein
VASCRAFLAALDDVSARFAFADQQKTWESIREYGRGGRARLTDAEGTDISWTYWDEYYDGTRYGFSSTPRNGHLFGHPVPPIIAKEDAAGVVAGTTSHF